MDRVSLQPLVYIEEVDLLGPEQPGERLSLDQPLIVAGQRWVDRRVELVGLGQTLTEYRIDVTQRRVQDLGTEAHAEGDGAACRNDITVVHA